MESSSSFLKAWLVATLAILGYAWADLRLNPELGLETHYSLAPDLSRLPDLLNWGGRLLHHGELGLLIANALALGGMVALVARGTASGLRSLRAPVETPRISIVTAAAPTSVPPPAP